MVFMLLTLLMISTVLRPLRSYENLSRRNSTELTQSSTYYMNVASLANDGDLRTTEKFCAHTAPGHTAWFQVDVGSPYNIHSVNIFYRRDGNRTYDWKQYRFRQFYLDISDVPAYQTTTSQRTRCYTDNTTAQNLPPNIIDIACEHTARYVIVETTYDAPEDQIPGAFLEICEIEVYGCSPNCLNNVCQNNGKCTQGCDDGWYGDTCNDACIPNCAAGSCDQQSGTCIAGCVQNWTGDRCDRCDATHHGPACSRECSVNCIQKTCNLTGSCTQGCKTGFYGDSCNNVCGSCPEGCNRYTRECEGACPIGKFGTQCDETCSQNCRQECHRQSGVCTSCVDGMFGESCNQTSSSGCVSGCDRYTGNCECTPAQQLSGLTTNTEPVLYGVAAVLCLSLVLNIFSFTWIFRRGMCKRQNGRQIQDKEFAVPPVVYDSVEDNTGYQELGHISGPSTYDEILKNKV